MSSLKTVPARRRASQRSFVEGLEGRTLMAAPLANGGFYAALPDTPLNVAAPGLFALASDPDSDPITAATISANPSHGIINLNNATGAFTYTPDAGYQGFDSFLYYVTAGGESSNHASVFLFVGSRGVTAADDVYTVNQNESLNVTAPGVLSNDVQTDGFPITAILDAAPTHGTLTLNSNGSLAYTPTANFFGVDTFTYHATDGFAGSSIATVTINVTKVQPPVGNLGDQVKALYDNGQLNHGQFTSLMKKLDLSENRNKTAQEIKKLNDFIKEVENLMKGKKPELTAAQGQSLIDAAMALIAAK
jgi:hypothetical protein